MSDIITENKSAAVKFLETHEAMQHELENERNKNAEMTHQLSELSSRCNLQDEMIKRLEAEKNKYLQYSVELSSQLQFMIAGCSRALEVAGRVQSAVALAAAAEPSKIDMEQLENIINRLPVNGREETPKPQAPFVFQKGDRVKDINSSVEGVVQHMSPQGIVYWGDETGNEWQDHARDLKFIGRDNAEELPVSDAIKALRAIDTTKD